VAADSRFVYPALLALLTAHEHCLSADANYLFLGISLQHAEADVVRSTLAEHRLEPGLQELAPERLAGLPTEGHLAPSAFARLFLPEISSESGAGRTLYIDSDTLTIANIGELAALPLPPGMVCGAVPAVQMETWGHPNAGLSGLLPPGIDRAYLNSGVMLIDNRAWADEQVSRRVVQAVHNRRIDLPCADQGWLNVVLAEKWCGMPTRFNYQLASRLFMRVGPLTLHPKRWSLEAVRPNRDASILHFVGPRKPWMDDAWPSAFVDQYRRAWRHYLGTPTWPRRSLPAWLWRRLRG